MVIRFSGLLLGNGMNNVSLRIFINPFVEPSIDYTDPRWIGAWWFTPTILGFLFIIPAVWISQFPRELRVADKVVDPESPNAVPLINKDGEADATEEAPPEESPEKTSNLSDMFLCLKRLYKNKIVLNLILSYIMRRFAHMPFHTYMVKYMELLYNVPSADAR